MTFFSLLKARWASFSTKQKLVYLLISIKKLFYGCHQRVVPLARSPRGKDILELP
jgi:hypothetical protein